MARKQKTAVRLRRLRQEGELSQREVARRAGISPWRLHRIETEKTEARIGEIEAIARALGISMIKFYEAA